MSEPLRVQANDKISVSFEIDMNSLMVLEKGLVELPFKASSPIIEGIKKAFTELHAKHAAKQEQDEKFEKVSGGGQGSAPQVEESLNDQSEVYEDASES